MDEFLKITLELLNGFLSSIFLFLFTIDSILRIWLVNVPSYTAVFTRLILVFFSIEAITAPLWMYVQAIGIF